MNQGFEAAVDLLVRLPGIHGAMLVSRPDGIVVTESLREGVRGPALAALAASLVSRLDGATGAAGTDSPVFLHLQAARGSIFVTPATADILIVSMGESDVNAGQVRLQMQRVSELVD